MSYEGFLALLILSLIAGLAVGLYVFADFKNLSRETIFLGIQKNWKYVAVLVFILLAVYIENITNDITKTVFSNDYTGLIHALSMNGAVVLAVQTSLRNPTLDWFFIIIYIYSYIFILFFTPLMFMFRNDTERLREYTLAFAINYIVLLAFYMAFAVRTPGYFELSPAKPILYSQPNLIKFIGAFDPLDNCFPSGHVSGPVTILLLLIPFKKNMEYKNYGMFLLILTPLIGISVLYLGIHWFIDIVFGVFLAMIAVWLVRNKKFMRCFNKCSKSIKLKLGLIKTNNKPAA